MLTIKECRRDEGQPIVPARCAAANQNALLGRPDFSNLARVYKIAGKQTMTFRREGEYSLFVWSSFGVEQTHIKGIP